MTDERRIRVTLTLSEWNALHSCATGEIESLAGDEYHGDTSKHLEAALKAMERARRSSGEKKRRKP